MKLLTKENLKALPKLYAQEASGENAIAHVKFFTPDAQWTWYATEFDGEDTFLVLLLAMKLSLVIFHYLN